MKKIIKENKLILQLQSDLTANKVKNYANMANNYASESSNYDLIILDLSNVKNIDSIGVTFIISLFKTIKKQNKKFKLSGCSEDIVDLFKLMKLDDFFELN